MYVASIGSPVNTVFVGATAVTLLFSNAFLATITVTSTFSGDGLWLSSPSYFTLNVFPVSVAFPTDVVNSSTNVQPGVNWSFISFNVCPYVAFNVVVVNSGASAFSTITFISAFSVAGL